MHSEIDENELVLYIWNHRWLSSLQKGIQTAHLIAEMSLLSTPEFTDWAVFYKTIIMLDGGSSDNLNQISNKLMFEKACLLEDAFEEDRKSLNGATTCVGAIFKKSNVPDWVKEYSLAV